MLRLTSCLFRQDRGDSGQALYYHVAPSITCRSANDLACCVYCRASLTCLSQTSSAHDVVVCPPADLPLALHAARYFRASLAFSLPTRSAHGGTCFACLPIHLLTKLHAAPSFRAFDIVASCLHPYGSACLLMSSLSTPDASALYAGSRRCSQAVHCCHRGCTLSLHSARCFSVPLGQDRRGAGPAVYCHLLKCILNAQCLRYFCCS